MKHISFLIGLLISAALAGDCRENTFIPWQSLHNPILQYSDWSIKDAAMAYRGGLFYVFFSAFYLDRGQVRSHVVEVSTRDFKQYSKPILNMTGQADGWIGMCSPDVQEIGDKYVMTFNSWGDKPDKMNALFYATSPDLTHWSNPAPLAANLTAGKRVIDAAIAHTREGYFAIWKEGKQVMRPRIAFATSLSGTFQFVNSGFPTLLMKEGPDNGLTHENFEFVQVDDRWCLLTTDYHPPSPHLYMLADNSDWLKWVDGYKIKIPAETFNTDNIANAAALYDWRKYDGYFYLLYAGRTEGETYLHRGWNRLGLARSKDLRHWVAAGSME